jgi:BolA protein
MSNSKSIAERISKIENALKDALKPKFLDVADESHLHVGHAGARAGLGHFHVTVVADQFAGLGMVKRHRLVYAAVGDLMITDIHALGIEARAPDEPPS